MTNSEIYRIAVVNNRRKIVCAIRHVPERGRGPINSDSKRFRDIPVSLGTNLLFIPSLRSIKEEITNNKF